MPRRLGIFLTIVASFVLLVPLSGLASAQEPTPTPGGGAVPPPGQAQGTICERPPSFIRSGGSVVNFGSVSLALPSGYGDFGITVITADPGPNMLQICYIAGSSAVVLNASTGGEIRREVTTPAANAVLDQVVAAARTATPAPVPASPAPIPTVTITVPNTGSGGLR